MNTIRKKEIDSLWIDTLYGNWVTAAAHGKEVEASALVEEAAKDFPFTLADRGSILCEKISKNMKYDTEFDEYLRSVDLEDPDLVDFIISNDIFGNLY